MAKKKLVTGVFTKEETKILKKMYPNTTTQSYAIPRNTFEEFPKTTCYSSRIVAHCHTMIYGFFEILKSLQLHSHGMQEVASSRWIL
ncbi:MAG: hypothetical protein ABFD79_04670 [Phycisphaerales bacterium]